MKYKSINKKKGGTMPDMPFQLDREGAKFDPFGKATISMNKKPAKSKPKKRGK